MHFNELVQNWFIAVQVKVAGCRVFAMVFGLASTMMLSLNIIFPLAWRSELIAYYIPLCTVFFFLYSYVCSHRFFFCSFKFSVKHLFILSTHHTDFILVCWKCIKSEYPISWLKCFTLVFFFSIILLVLWTTITFVLHKVWIYEWGINGWFCDDRPQ